MKILNAQYPLRGLRRTLLRFAALACCVPVLWSSPLSAQSGDPEPPGFPLPPGRGPVVPDDSVAVDPIPFDSIMVDSISDDALPTTPSAPADSASPELWRAGLTLSGARLFHSASFRGLPGVPSCCPDYESGSGWGIAIGGRFELPMIDGFRIGAGLDYLKLGGRLVTDESEFVFDGFGGVDAIFRHTIESDIHTLVLSPYGLYEPIDRLRLFMGPQFLLTLGTSFQQEERILSPSTIRFENDRNVRMEFEGSIPGARSMGLGLAGGIGTEFALRGSTGLTLAPELSAWYGFTDVAGGIDWRIHGIRIGLTAFHRHIRTIPVATRPEPTPTYLLPPIEIDRTPSGAGG